MGGCRNGGKGITRGSGLGAGLANRAKKHGAITTAGSFINYNRHTTDLMDPANGGRPNLTSVMERNDLDEFMAMASLSDRDFTAERRQAVVVSLGGDGEAEVGDIAKDDKAQEAKEKAEALHADELRVPRRPPWTMDMSADVLDVNERRYFLEWRRALAAIEEDERLTLTPFEKNLEIWRQLWRVCERSDIVVQVVDARDPMFYRCPDLEDYVTELSVKKKAILLLNKADLLSPELRRAWADYFDAHGIAYLFWSAKSATEIVDAEEAQLRAHKILAAAAAASTNADLEFNMNEHTGVDAEDEDEDEDEEEAAGAGSGGEPAPKKPRDRADVLTREELLEILEAEAEAAAGKGARANRRDGRVVVGMVGYPNVGKSSTVNALVRAKKTGVSATPGKTKHYQSLELGDGLLLADCPGLVFPSFTASRAELVCNGVLPIDRLTDVRQPVGIVAAKISRELFESIYKLKLPLPALHEDQKRNATAGEVLRAYAAARGMTVQMGRPDEQRAGRAILKDYANGKLLFCVGPPGYTGKLGVDGGGGAIKKRDGDPIGEDDEEGGEEGEEEGLVDEDGIFNGGGGAGPSGGEGGVVDDPLAAQLLQEMMMELGGGAGVPDKSKRAEHKFHKKSKVKGRIKHKGVGEDHTAGGDAFRMGKKGGMMPAAQQALVRSSINSER